MMKEVRLINRETGDYFPDRRDSSNKIPRNGSTAGYLK